MRAVVGCRYQGDQEEEEEEEDTGRREIVEAGPIRVYISVIMFS